MQDHERETKREEREERKNRQIGGQNMQKVRE